MRTLGRIALGFVIGCPTVACLASGGLIGLLVALAVALVAAAHVRTKRTIKKIQRQTELRTVMMRIETEQQIIVCEAELICEEDRERLLGEGRAFLFYSGD